MTDVVIVSDYAGDLFARKVAETHGWTYVNTDITRFSDDEFRPQLTENIRGREVYYICPFQPDPIRRYTEINFINSALRDSSAERITDVPTYLGYMKQDWKDRPRVPISIRDVAIMMEQYAKSVLTIDMHSPQIQGVFRIPLDHLDGSVLFADVIRNNYDLSKVIIASADIGGAKRAQKLAERLSLEELAIVYKLRDPKTGRPKSTGVMGDVKNKKVILYDDQGVSLESLEEGAKLVMNYDAESVDGACTHLIGTKKDGITAEDRVARSLIGTLYVSDTIPRPDSYFAENPKIKLVTSINLFTEAIRRIHNNESLSALFR